MSASSGMSTGESDDKAVSTGESDDEVVSFGEVDDMVPNFSGESDNRTLSYGESDYYRLEETLMRNYRPHIRPVYSHRTTTNVSLVMQIVAIPEVSGCFLGFKKKKNLSFFPSPVLMTT